ncbi:MAG: NAD-dependent epimerase/dehydratase family protein [Euryarchaeota archaeon]|nr:NAD-dependent epimerase/dehydratase family protein [Euryarchaeota archaeon]
MKVLITGGAGFIGSSLVNLLSGEGHEVVVFDKMAEDRREGRVSYVRGDIFDRKHLGEVLSSCEGVVHLIGLPDARKAQERPHLSFDLNVVSVEAVLEALRDSPGKTRFLLPSSAAIYGVTRTVPIPEETPAAPVNVYGYHKVVAEALAETYHRCYGIGTTVLRLFNVYGPRGAGILNLLVDKHRRGESIELYGTRQVRDFIHVDDVARVFARAAATDSLAGQVVNVGTGVGIPIQRVVDIARERLPGLRVVSREAPGGQGLYDSVADVSRLRKHLGWVPEGGDQKLKSTLEVLLS